MEKREESKEQKQFEEYLKKAKPNDRRSIIINKDGKVVAINKLEEKEIVKHAREIDENYPFDNNSARELIDEKDPFGMDYFISECANPNNPKRRKKAIFNSQGKDTDVPLICMIQS